MSTEIPNLPTRRQFLQATSGLAATTMLGGFRFPEVNVAGSDMIQVALVGCGGRGGGAAVNALSTKSGPIKLVAMADAFPDRLAATFKNLQGSVAGQMDVPEDRRF